MTGADGKGAGRVLGIAACAVVHQEPICLAGIEVTIALENVNVCARAIMASDATRSRGHCLRLCVCMRDREHAPAACAT